MNLEETKKALTLIESHTDCIAWVDFADRGNACTGRIDILTDPTEIAQNSVSLSNVKQIMPKQSDLHLNISPKVATEIGAKWVTYDWLVKTLSRILESKFEDFEHILNLSICVKKRNGIVRNPVIR